MAKRLLLKTYESPEAFQQEYASDLAAGGVFIPTTEAYQLCERVSVSIELPFCRQAVQISGEVVHQVTVEMAEMGGDVGVAVQFDGASRTARTLLEPLRVAAGANQYETKPQDIRRRAPRFAARVPVMLDFGDGPVSGHTRNLSQTGVLVSVPDRGAEPGERVRLRIHDPESSQSMEVDAVVVRQVESDGGVAAVALDFVLTDSERPPMAMMIESIQSSEHARRLGGVSGDIGDLGVATILQMFGTAGKLGTLSLRIGEREGLIGFEAGMLRFVRLGPVSGMKALVRLLAWTEGNFEFHARLDPVESREPALPLEPALIEGLRLLDEERAAGESKFAHDAVLRVVDEKGADADDFSKTEAAIIDLARVGFEVSRALAVIPESDLEVRRTIASLVERNIIGV